LTRAGPCRTAGGARRRRAPVLLAVLALAGCARDPGALARRPETPTDASVNAATTQVQQGEVEAALRGYREAMTQDPAAVRPHLRYVQTLLRMGRREEARRYYAERAARPDATDVERTMAERLRTRGASSALRRVYTLAAERNPRSPWWRLALAEVELAEADAWNERRLEAAERGDPGEESKAFGQAVGAVRRADRAVAQAAAIDADAAEVHLFRGFLRATEGDLHAGATAQIAAFRAAEASFERAARRDPDLAEAWAGLGETRHRIGDKGGALSAYLEAARRAPGEPTYRIGLGVVLHDLDRLQEAAEQYRQAGILLPHDPDPALRRGDALADARRWDAAIDAYEDALKRDPQTVEAYYKMGVVLEFRGRHGEARGAYERYMDLGGPRAANVQRRIDRLLRSEEGR
jgi:tetratricopeptide (TPR) repeat protein